MSVRAVDFNEFLARPSSLGADGTRPTSTQGTSVTPGGTNTYGSYASLGVISSADDAYEIELTTHTVNVTAENRMVMITLGADPAGGTSFTDIWSDVFVAGSSEVANTHFRFRLPYFLKAGTTLGVKAASLNATTTAIRVHAKLFCKPTRPDLIMHGKHVQTFGVTSPTVAGVAVTPGTVSEGAYAEIGTLDKPLFFFDFGMVVDDTTMGAAMLHVDIALGDATNKRVIISNAPIWTTAGEGLMKHIGGSYARGAVGDKIYARAQSHTAIDSNYSIAVYGVGG